MRLNEVTFEKNIFESLYTIYGDIFPYFSEYTSLDITFITHYGDRKITKFLTSFIQNDTIHLAKMAILSNTIKTLFKKRWDDIHNIYNIEYNPIENYKIHTEEKPNVERTEEMTDDYQHKIVKKEKTDITTTSTDNGVGGVYGFNSDSPVNASKTDTLAQDNIHSDMNDNESDTTETQIGGKKFTESGEIINDKVGILYNNPQDLLMKEIELRKYKFFDYVFSDLADLLTLQIYE